MGKTSSKQIQEDDQGAKKSAQLLGQKVPEVEEVVSKMTKNFALKSIDLEEFIGYFDADFQFLYKLFDFTCGLSSANNPGYVDHESLRMMLQLMILEHGHYTYKVLAAFDLQPIELFVMIYLNIKDGNVKEARIPYTTAVEMIQSIIEIISWQETSPDIVKGVSLMFEEGKEITGSQFYSTYRDNFEHGRLALRQSFRSLICTKECSLPLYDISGASIMNQSILALLRMSCSKIAQITTLHCLYNSNKSGSSFNRLAFSLNGYNAPTFILIRHIYKTTDGKSHRGLLGAYVASPWKDEIGYWGDNNVYIFSLLPRIRFLYAYKGKGGNNFVYLNTKKIPNSKYRAGMGFGGADFKDFRIWLDDDIQQKSYTTFNDDTFPTFNLNEGFEENLVIDCVEAWGLGSEDDLSKQGDFRQMRDVMVSNARKVDKKKFLQGEFASQAFGKTFAHREQIEGDLNHMKQEAGREPHK